MLKVALKADSTPNIFHKFSFLSSEDECKRRKKEAKRFFEVEVEFVQNFSLKNKVSIIKSQEESQQPK